MRAFGLVTMIALLPVAATACGNSTAAPPCSEASVRTAVAEEKPTVDIGERTVVDPSQIDRVLCFDVTGDGRVDAVASAASGGTAGDIGWFLFAPRGGRWRLAGSGSGYKLGLRRSGSQIEIVQAVYRKRDPNCCPTGGFDRTFYRWDGKQLLVAKRTHSRTFQ